MKKNLTNMVVLKTEDEGKTWEPVLPDDIPDFINTNEVITELAAGNFCKEDDESSTWYQGIALDDDTGQYIEKLGRDESIYD